MNSKLFVKIATDLSQGEFLLFIFIFGVEIVTELLFWGLVDLDAWSYLAISDVFNYLF